MLGQIAVCPGVVGQLVALAHGLDDRAGIGLRPLANQEESCLRAAPLQHPVNLRRPLLGRAVVDGEGHQPLGRCGPERHRRLVCLRVRRARRSRRRALDDQSRCGGAADCGPGGTSRGQQAYSREKLTAVHELSFGHISGRFKIRYDQGRQIRRIKADSCENSAVRPVHVRGRPAGRGCRPPESHALARRERRGSGLLRGGNAAGQDSCAAGTPPVRTPSRNGSHREIGGTGRPHAAGQGRAAGPRPAHAPRARCSRPARSRRRPPRR